jgi:hypothetical protein
MTLPKNMLAESSLIYLGKVYVDPKNREDKPTRAGEQGRCIQNFEVPGLRKDGSKIWISVNMRAVR